MSNIDKHIDNQELRERAESTISILENIAGFEPSDIDGDSVEIRFETEDGFDTGCDVSIVDQCQKAADVVRALLDELEAKDKRITELEARDKPKFVQCWSCKRDIEVLAIADCDGYCPRCAAQIDLDDEPYAAAGKGGVS